MAGEDERQPEGANNPNQPEKNQDANLNNPVNKPTSPEKDTSNKPGEASQWNKGTNELPKRAEGMKDVGKDAGKGFTQGAGAASEGAGTAASAAGAAGKGAGIPSLPEMPKMPQGPERDEEGNRKPPLGENPLEGAGKITKGAGEAAEKTGKGIQTAGGLAADVMDLTGVAAPVGEATRAATQIAGKAAEYGGKAAKKVGEKVEEKGREVAEEAKGAEEGEEEGDMEVQAAKAAEKGKKRLKFLGIGCLATGALGTLGCGGIILLLLIVIVPVLLITGGGGLGTGGGGVAGNTYLNQGDPPWGSQVYCGSYGTIGQTGCTVTTGAMALRSIGIDTDPEQLAQKLCPARGSWGFGVAGQQAAASFYGVKLVQVNSESELIQAVSAGHAVGIYADPAGDISTHGSPHSVLVIGISGNQMTVMDPSDNNGRGKSKQENVTRTCSLSSWTGASQKWGYYYTK